jgi:uncharacterized protein (DUF1800 family)
MSFSPLTSGPNLTVGEGFDPGVRVWTLGPFPNRLAVAATGTTTLAQAFATNTYVKITPTDPSGILRSIRLEVQSDGPASRPLFTGIRTSKDNFASWVLQDAHTPNLDTGVPYFKTLIADGIDLDLSSPGAEIRFYFANSEYWGPLWVRNLELVKTDTGTPAAAPALPGSAASSRFLQQAAFGANDTNLAAVESMGMEAWLDAQLNQPVTQDCLQWMQDQGYLVRNQVHPDEPNNLPNHNNFYFGYAALWERILRDDNAVRVRLGLAMSEMFVVGAGFTGAPNVPMIQWHNAAAADYFDMLCHHATGNFRDLLEAMTKHYAMGRWLDMYRNFKPGPGKRVDENYGREIMQLFSIGLVQLNLDGTPVLDGNGKTIDTYNTADVIGVSTALTGYDDNRANMSGVPDGSSVLIYEYTLTTTPLAVNSESNHSDIAKSFLGVTIPANTLSGPSLATVMNTLFNHPNVGPFFAKQMIQRLVTSNPSPAYVQRVATVFNNNGSGVRGDLRAVFKAILLDTEARSAPPPESTGFGKLRTLMNRVAQWSHTFGSTSRSGRWLVRGLSNTSESLRQDPMGAPSVFNWYRPGFVKPNSNSSAAGMVAPEFAMLNETSAAANVNFFAKMIDETNPELADLDVAYAAELALVDRPEALVARLDRLLTADQLSASTKSLIIDALRKGAVRANSPLSYKLKAVHAAVLMVMTSPDYAVQR